MRRVEFIVEGKRFPTHCEVKLNGEPLPLHLDKCDDSPDGFERGYGGSGPAQLAFCILYEYYLNVDGLKPELAQILALRYHQTFKWAVIAPIALNRFDLIGNVIYLKLKDLIND